VLPQARLSRSQEEQNHAHAQKADRGWRCGGVRTAMAVGPALADPINNAGNPVVPKDTDVVGVGSDTLQSVMDQLSFDYNKSHATGPRLFSWDALNPKTGQAHDMIKLKAHCTAIQRPNGSTEGINALKLNQKTADKKHFCIDYARSSRGRQTGDPPKGKAGILFVALAKDAVTWAANGTTNAPANLTTAQLHDIYSCVITNWSQVGGKAGTIDPQLPQDGSGTRAFFLKAIGLDVPGPGGCVGSTAEENEGVNSVLFKKPNVIFPYSIGKYIAQVFHSADCTNAACTGSPPCHPTASQNKFGCDAHGKMVLHKINGTAPTVGTGAKTTINPKFTAAFVRIVFNVVRFSTSTSNHIPASLQKLFDAKKKAGSPGPVSGWICSNSTAHQDLINYGFLPTPFCGTGS
jgi:ABC-type phosphate transport system substrate-binding protein